jgi:NTE family protein
VNDNLPHFFTTIKKSPVRFPHEQGILTKTTIHKTTPTDGGVYDNFGLESVFKPDNGGSLSEGIDFLIISNASLSTGVQSYKRAVSAKNLKRLLDISTGQVAALRSRSVMEFIKNTNQGIFIKIGNSAEKIATESKCSEELKRQLVESCLSAEQADKAMNHPTTLRKPNKSDIEMLMRHGYEVADCTYRCYQNKN